MNDVDGAARRGQFDDPVVKSHLDSLPVPSLVAMLGHYETVTITWSSPAPVWKPGEPKPPLADPDPAVCIAMGRCAASRMKSDSLATRLNYQLHPQTCGWCDYPVPALLAAMEWASEYAGFITEEFMVWDLSGRKYRRATGRAGQYLNSDWEAFRRMPQEMQRDAIEMAIAKSA